MYDNYNVEMVPEKKWTQSLINLWSLKINGVRRVYCSSILRSTQLKW